MVSCDGIAWWYHVMVSHDGIAWCISTTTHLPNFIFLIPSQLVPSLLSIPLYLGRYLENSPSAPGFGLYPQTQIYMKFTKCSAIVIGKWILYWRFCNRQQCLLTKPSPPLANLASFASHYHHLPPSRQWTYSWVFIVLCPNCKSSKSFTFACDRT